MPSLGIAHGACILAHRETYRKLGGHSWSAPKSSKTPASPMRGAPPANAPSASTRNTSSASACTTTSPGIWNGFQKNLYPAFRHNISFFAFLLVHFVCFLLPFVAGFPLAAALVILTRVALAVRFRHPFWSVLLHPFAEAVLIALGLVSFYRCASGRGVSWKGRLYRV